MGLPNLSGSNIQDTYQRVLQKAGTDYYDGNKAPTWGQQ